MFMVKVYQYKDYNKADDIKGNLHTKNCVCPDFLNSVIKYKSHNILPPTNKNKNQCTFLQLWDVMILLL